MTLVDFILTYERDGKIVCNLFDYYEEFIRPLDERFKNHSYYENDLVLCYLKDHADVNPSMGYISDKFHKGVKLCHCFGCGRTYNVVRLNQVISSQYFGKELSEKESCVDLATKFNIDISEFDELADDDYEGKHLAKLRKIEQLKRRYTFEDFKDKLLEQRKSGKVDLGRVNAECVKMIATTKQLYD